MKHTAGGDPLRSLSLLWRRQTKPSRSGLSVDAIVAASIGLADSEGLEALSMRRVAERLGAGTMSLYTHVPTKAELIDLAVDAVIGELYPEGGENPGGMADWREALRCIARQNWDLYQRHPWLLEINQARPALGPNIIRKYEIELGPLDGLGLSDLEMDSVLTLLLTHVEGSARGRLRAQQLRKSTGMSDTEWWEKTAPVLDQVGDFKNFPLGSRVGAAAGQEYGAYDPDHILRFGLERILDGVEVLMKGNEAPGASRGT